MKKIWNHAFSGSLFAFLLATSCCWLPWLIIAIGGASSLAGFAAGLEQFSALFFIAGFVLLGLGWLQFKKKKSKMKEVVVILESEITCPECGYQKTETMPENACQYFYDCENCKTVLKPKKGDCCVYCSYGTVPCPPIQAGNNCCIYFVRDKKVE